MNFLLAILSVCLIVHRAGAVHPLRFRHGHLYRYGVPRSRASEEGARVLRQVRSQRQRVEPPPATQHDADPSARGRALAGAASRNCPFVQQVDSWALSESTNDKGTAKAVAGAPKPILTKVDNGASYILEKNHGEKKHFGDHRKRLQMLGVRDDGIAYAKEKGASFLIPWNQLNGPAEALGFRCALYNKGESIQDLGQKVVYAVVKVPTIPRRHHGEFTFEIPYYEMVLSPNDDCGPDVMISQKIEASSIRCKFMANLQCRSGTPTSADSVNNCDVKWCNETQVAIWPCTCKDTTCLLLGVPGSRPPTPVSPSSLTPTSSTSSTESEDGYVTAYEDLGSPAAEAQEPPPSPSSIDTL